MVEYWLFKTINLITIIDRYSLQGNWKIMYGDVDTGIFIEVSQNVWKINKQTNKQTESSLWESSRQV